MRHAKGYRHLNRTHEHRKALWANMAGSLIEHEQIKTTLPKAKELRRVVEPIITRSKKDSVANRRIIFNQLRDKVVIGKLFNEIGPRFEKRPGGYLRILKLGPRAGDAAPMALVQLLDIPENNQENQETDKSESS